jgi:hypothetical protein
MYCDPSLGEYCCLPRQGLGGGGPPMCLPQSAPCGGVPVRCDKTADCPAGQMCCGTDQNGGYVDVSCASDCSGGGPGQTFQFCDPAVGDCPPNTHCRMSMDLPGYHVCL